ncbi:unnamed protein product [Malus baccata var. baccata]
MSGRALTMPNRHLSSVNAAISVRLVTSSKRSSLATMRPISTAPGFGYDFYSQCHFDLEFLIFRGGDSKESGEEEHKVREHVLADLDFDVGLVTWWNLRVLTWD